MVGRVVVVVGPAPFEEKQSAFPPALLLVRLLGVVVFLGNGLLELEVNRVYGSGSITLVPPRFFQNLRDARTEKWIRSKFDAE